MRPVGKDKEATRTDMEQRVPGDGPKLNFLSYRPPGQRKAFLCRLARVADESATGKESSI